MTSNTVVRRTAIVASKSDITTHQSRLTNHAFLIDTNKPHRIIIPLGSSLKTKDKQFSIQYKFALGSIGLPATGGIERFIQRACPPRRVRQRQTRRACPERLSRQLLDAGPLPFLSSLRAFPQKLIAGHPNIKNRRK